MDINFEEMFKLSCTKFSDQSKVQILLSFYSNYLDLDSEILHSEMIECDTHENIVEW